MKRWQSPNMLGSVAYLLLVAAAGAGLIRDATAGEPKWPTGTYNYLVVDEDLRSVLMHFGANNGVRIVLSDKVQGHVHGRLQSAPPRDFLESLTREFGLDWYYDGAALWISAADEASTKLLPLRGVRIESLRKSLAASGLLDSRFPLHEGVGPNTAVISGPPRYLAMAEEVLNALAAGLNRPIVVVPSTKRTVTIFRGATINRVEFP